MNGSTHVERARARLLQSLFQMLYTRLGVLHEPIGSLVFGAAWNGRRRHVVPSVRTGPMLDLGCGEGRLLRCLDAAGAFALGIEPSAQMSRRARQNGAAIVRATAQSLPLRDASVWHVVATYPGPWIGDPRTWDEIARVAAPGATVTVLLGGDVTRGRGAGARALLMRLAYGRDRTSTGALPRLGNALVTGDYATVDDSWGTTILWRGVRGS